MSRFARDGREPLPISSLWFQGAILTYLIGFSILGVLAYVVYQEQPPIPDRVVTQDGKTIFTRADILDGMNVFQRYGIMEYGSVYGHAASLGPDFTANYLHRSAELLARSRSATADDPIARAQVVEELKQNSFDQRTATLTWSAARAASHAELVNHYKTVFQSPISRQGGQAEWIRNPKLIEQLAAVFGWTAWTAATLRPGKTYSYTNNWPPDPLAGNTVTADAVTWSVISIIALLGGAGPVLYFFGRYDWLGLSSNFKIPSYCHYLLSRSVRTYDTMSSAALESTSLTGFIFPPPSRMILISSGSLFACTSLDPRWRNSTFIIFAIESFPSPLAPWQLAHFLTHVSLPAATSAAHIGLIDMITKIHEARSNRNFIVPPVQFRF